MAETDRETFDMELRGLERDAGSIAGRARYRAALWRAGRLDLEQGFTGDQLDDIERTVMIAIRATDPRTRARGIVFYSRSTSATKELSCKLCNRVVTTWCSKWPRTKASEEAEETHRENCLAILAPRLLLRLRSEDSSGS